MIHQLQINACPTMSDQHLKWVDIMFGHFHNIIFGTAISTYLIVRVQKCTGGVRQSCVRAMGDDNLRGEERVGMREEQECMAMH